MHDAIWAIFAAVYGGAVHPTAEGHAAMADATLPAIREVLGVARAGRAGAGAAAAGVAACETRVPTSAR